MHETIDTEYLTDFLEALLAIPSPTGYTDQVVRRCCTELDELGVDYELTRRGAIRAVVRGESRDPARAMIGHVDTLGAQVRRLKPNGRAALVPIGHWSSRFAEGARVTLLTRSGAYRGTILPLKASGHTFGKEVDTQETDWDHVELRIDVEANNGADLAEHGIAIGDYVAIDPRPDMRDNGYINARHLDDKAGVASMFAAIKALLAGDVRLPVDTYFLFSIAEEVGVGASAVLHGEIASLVAIDNGTTAPGQNSSEKGVTIGMADSVGPFDYHLTNKLIDLCIEDRIPFQRDIFRYYRCDSASAIEAGNDIRTALITFGVDASHGYERIHLDALESVARLMVAYARSPVQIKRDREELSSLKGFTRQPTELSEEA
ncbi:osmoprotectant NAGGN system M42 family peptidase [Elongatibacter sediminis]|uniref:Osmoprotectant NAGGN system M42 family peptidase n=1 Tax=Elongatibacter sediminis TaxID=3119006 RepID=A0AAW9R953_9GAMM